MCFTFSAELNLHAECEGHERGLFPVCVVCVQGTLTQRTRKWVCEAPAAGLRVVEGGGRLPCDV